MRVFDASSIVYAWDNYPIQQFPSLWEWIADLIEDEDIVMSQVAFDEVNDIAPECADYLRDCNVTCLEVTNRILQRAYRIKRLLGINNDDYHPNGVGENDLIIIATAKIEDVELVTDEAKQTTLPDNMKRYKIPAVCNLREVSINCMNFVDFIKLSGQVFG